MERNEGVGLNTQYYLALTGILLGTCMAATAVVHVLVKTLEHVYGRAHTNLEQRFRIQKRLEHADPAQFLKKARRAVELNKELANLILCALVSGVVFFLISGGGIAIRLTMFAVGVTVGIFAYYFYAKYTKNTRKIKVLRELSLVYDTLSIYMDAGENLPTAIGKVLPALDVTKESFERFLVEYNYNIREALLNLEKNLGTEESGVLVSVMLQIVSTGSIKEIAMTEGGKLENARKTAYRVELAVRPIYRQLTLTVPVFLGMATMFYVLGKHVYVSIMSLSGGAMIN